jgi:hypothetical protein
LYPILLKIQFLTITRPCGGFLRSGEVMHTQYVSDTALQAYLRQRYAPYQIPGPRDAAAKKIREENMRRTKAARTTYQP